MFLNVCKQTFHISHMHISHMRIYIDHELKFVSMLAGFANQQDVSLILFSDWKTILNHEQEKVFIESFIHVTFNYYSSAWHFCTYKSMNIAYTKESFATVLQWFQKQLFPTFTWSKVKHNYNNKIALSAFRNQGTWWSS